MFDDLEYLKAPNTAYQIKHSDDEIKSGKSEQAVRKIFFGVELDNFEKSKILLMEEQLIKNQIQLPQYWTSLDTLRYLYSAGFKFEKCIENIKIHLNWLNNPFYHIISNKSEEYLKKGLIYQLGRDKKLRPVIYFDIPKINEHIDDLENIVQALCILLSTVKKHMFLPYHVEQWLILLDIQNLGLLRLPRKAITRIIEAATINFCTLMDQMFILNPSFILKAGWNLIKSRLSPEQSSKIQFLDTQNKEDLEIIHKKIDFDQLEQKYGGKINDISSFWPIPNVYTKFNQNNQEISNEQNIESQYFSFLNSVEYFTIKTQGSENNQNSFANTNQNQISIQNAQCCQCSIM